jgi:hypothetical protein
MLLKISTLLIIIVFSSTTFANENLIKNCKYSDMLNFAEKNSLIKQTTSDNIVFRGGPTHANTTSVTLAADLVSQSGLREISMVSCNVFGKMKSLGGSIQKGSVYFNQKVSSVNVDPPLVSDLDPVNPSISMLQATTSNDGFLSSSDYSRIFKWINQLESGKLSLKNLYVTENLATNLLSVGHVGYNSSSAVTINSSSRGLLMPTMTTKQRDVIANPVAGLMIYNTTTGSFDYYNGASWQMLK